MHHFVMPIRWIAAFRRERDANGDADRRQSGAGWTIPLETGRLGLEIPDRRLESEPTGRE